MKLSLWFITDGTPELFRFSVAGEGRATRFAERGKLALPSSAAATFQWTSAVRAFSILTVGTRFVRMSASRNTYELSGEKGSPAASIDFALSKPAAWAREAFCQSREHRRDIRRIFRIANSEQKRAGPVTVAFSPMVDVIKIFLDGRELVRREEVGSLLSALGGNTAAAELKPDSSRDFAAEFQNDAELALQETELLEQLGIKQARARLQKFAWAKNSVQVRQALKELAESIPAAGKRYRGVQGSPVRTPLKVRCPAMAIGVLILFRYAKREWKIPLEIEYAFPSTGSMLEDSSKLGSAALVLSWGAISRAASLGRTYRAAMLLPRTAMDLIADREAPQSQVCLASDARGYPMQYLQQLRRAPRFRKLRAVNSNFAEIHAALKLGTRAAILSFPFSVFLSRRYGMEVVAPYCSASRIADNVLFINSKTSPAWESLVPFLREAWSQLLADRNLVAAEIEALLSDESYTRYLDRCAGIAGWSK